MTKESGCGKRNSRADAGAECGVPAHASRSLLTGELSPRYRVYPALTAVTTCARIGILSGWSATTFRISTTSWNPSGTS